MQFKPKKDWKINCSITTGRTAGGQIRWKGAAGDGADRFLVIVERNRGKADHFRRTATLVGTANDAYARMTTFIQEYDRIDANRLEPTVHDSMVRGATEALAFKRGEIDARITRRGSGTPLRPHASGTHPREQGTHAVALGVLGVAAIGAAYLFNRNRS